MPYIIFDACISIAKYNICNNVCTLCSHYANLNEPCLMEYTYMYGFHYMYIDFCFSLKGIRNSCQYYKILTVVTILLYIAFYNMYTVQTYNIIL